MPVQRSHPIQLDFTIEPASLQKIAREGRLLEFADAVSTLAAAHIKKEIVDHVAKGARGPVAVAVGFDDDDEYGTPPRPWPHFGGSWELAMRELAVRDVTNRFAASHK